MYLYQVPDVWDYINVTDNCGDVKYRQWPLANTTVLAGNHTILVNVTDLYGNIANCSIQLVVMTTGGEVVIPPPIGGSSSKGRLGPGTYMCSIFRSEYRCELQF